MFLAKFATMRKKKQQDMLNGKEKHTKKPVLQKEPTPCQMVCQ